MFKTTPDGACYCVTYSSTGAHGQKRKCQRCRHYTEPGKHWIMNRAYAIITVATKGSDRRMVLAAKLPRFRKTDRIGLNHSTKKA